MENVSGQEGGKCPPQGGPPRRATAGKHWGRPPSAATPSRPPSNPTHPAAEPPRAPWTAFMLPPVGGQRAPRPPQWLCDSLLFHSLEFEDVHSLSVAGGRQEHAVHAEGQGADAHTPGARGAGSVTLLPGRGGQTATSTAAPSGREVTEKEGSHDRCRRVFFFLSSHLLKPCEEGECLKADTLTERSFNRSSRGHVMKGIRASLNHFWKNQARLTALSLSKEN